MTIHEFLLLVPVRNTGSGKAPGARSERSRSAQELQAAFRARKDEIVAHGRSNSEGQSTLTDGEEKQLIAETTAIIRRHEGAPPQGWLGPWIAESAVTPDLLKEHGYYYVPDCKASEGSGLCQPGAPRRAKAGAFAYD